MLRELGDSDDFKFSLIEFYKYTNANAAISLAELLVYYQPLLKTGSLDNAIREFSLA